MQPVPLGEAGATSELTTKAQQFAFGSERELENRTIVLPAKPKLSADAPLIAEAAGDLEMEGGGDSFPLEGIGVTAKVTELGAVQLKICLDPEQPEEVGRGRYVGAIQVGGPGIETATVSLEVTLRESILLALVLAVVGMLVGLWAKMYTDLGKDPEASISLDWMGKYVKRAAFGTAVLLGILGVALSLVQLYGDNPTWGSARDMFAIFIAGVGLQVTGSTLVDFVAPFKAPPPPEK